LDVRNIFSWSYTEPCWRCSKLCLQYLIFYFCGSVWLLFPMAEMEIFIHWVLIPILCTGDYGLEFLPQYSSCYSSLGLLGKIKPHFHLQKFSFRHLLVTRSHSPMWWGSWYHAALSGSWKPAFVGLSDPSLMKR